MEGVKFDNNKPRFSLLPIRELWQIVEVLEYGARKYEVDNWKRVPNCKQRYFDAAMRHILARQNGEVFDSETKMPHLAHAMCCLFFWLWHDNENIKPQEPEIDVIV